MRLEQIMTKAPCTCRTDQSLDTAAQIMWDHDCGIVPVVDGAGRLVGVITDRDVCMAAYTRGLPLRSISIASTMAKQVHSCRPKDDLATAERMMADKRVRRIPVIDEQQRPVGIISLGDIARAAEKPGAAARGAAPPCDVLHTLSAISQPEGGVVLV
jgi:CBS domain-containing protein